MLFSLEEVKKIVQQFSEEYRTSFSMIGNTLTTGVGKDPETGDYCIMAYLETDNLRGTIPETYQGVKVRTNVVGPILAL
jgi:hypothetical protein